MKKILAMLSAVGLATTTATSVIACSSTSPHGNIPSNDGDKPVSRSLMDYDWTEAQMQLSANSIADWASIYSSYNTGSNENFKYYQQTSKDSDYNPSDPDTAQGHASALATLGTYYTWYGVVAQYALMQMKFLDEGINLNGVDWDFLATQDFSTLTSLFYSLYDISNIGKQFNLQLNAFRKINLRDENYGGDTATQEQDKADWDRVENVVNNYYLGSLSKIQGTMLTAIQIINPYFDPNHIVEFDNSFNYTINSNSITEVNIVNASDFASTNLTVDNSLDDGIKVKYGNNGLNSIVITIDNSVKSGSLIHFRMYEPKNSQLPSTTPTEMAKLDEIITLYVN